MSVQFDIEFNVSYLVTMLFIAFLIWIDYKLFSMGCDGYIFEYKTPAEKRLQEAIIRERELNAGIVPPENEG